MREIEFRGKTLETNRWVYGYFTVGRTSGDATIESKDKTRLVDPATVGQFTGLSDKNGKRIYDGDIVATKYGRLCIMEWFNSPSHLRWDLYPIHTMENIKLRAPDKYDLWKSENLEIVGNIHDTPELL